MPAHLANHNVARTVDTTVVHSTTEEGHPPSLKSVFHSFIDSFINSSNYSFIHSFIHSVLCQLLWVANGSCKCLFQLLSLSWRIVWCQSSRQLFDTCSPWFPFSSFALQSSLYCSQHGYFHYVARIRNLSASRLFIIIVSFTPISVVHQYLWYENSN